MVKNPLISSKMFCKIDSGRYGNVTLGVGLNAIFDAKSKDKQRSKADPVSQMTIINEQKYVFYYFGFKICFSFKIKICSSTNLKWKKQSTAQESNWKCKFAFGGDSKLSKVVYTPPPPHFCMYFPHCSEFFKELISVWSTKISTLKMYPNVVWACINWGVNVVLKKNVTFRPVKESKNPHLHNQQHDSATY